MEWLKDFKKAKCVESFIFPCQVPIPGENYFWMLVNRYQVYFEHILPSTMPTRHSILLGHQRSQVKTNHEYSLDRYRIYF